MTMQKIILTLLSSLAIPMASFAQSVEEVITEHPSKEIVAFYASNLDEVEQLYGIVLESQDGKARLEALSELAVRFPLVAEVASRNIVASEDTQLSMLGIDILQNATVMSDHDHSADPEAFSPIVRYTMNAHMLSRDALREVILDDRKELRDAVAPFLASLSDQQALELISSEDNAALYPEAEVARLLTLSGSEHAVSLLQNYISSDDTEAQAASVEYLAAFPEFQPRIRSEVFLDVSKDPSVRSVAAESLSLYDSTFPTYALIVAGEEGVPPNLYSSVIGGYVEATIGLGQLGPDAAGSVALQANNYLESVGEIDGFQPELKSIEAIIERLDSFSNL